MTSQMSCQSDQGTQVLPFDVCVQPSRVVEYKFLFFISLLPQLVSPLFYNPLITLDMSSRKMGELFNTKE